MGLRRDGGVGVVGPMAVSVVTVALLVLAAQAWSWWSMRAVRVVSPVSATASAAASGPTGGQPPLELGAESGRDVVERVAAEAAAVRRADGAGRHPDNSLVAVRERTAAALAGRYPGRFIHRHWGVDFEDRWTGERIELTTRATFSPHLSRTGEYRSVQFAFYAPACYTPACG